MCVVRQQACDHLFPGLQESPVGVVRGQADVLGRLSGKAGWAGPLLVTSAKRLQSSGPGAELGGVCRVLWGPGATGRPCLSPQGCRAAVPQPPGLNFYKLRWFSCCAFRAAVWIVCLSLFSCQGEPGSLLWQRLCVPGEWVSLAAPPPQREWRWSCSDERRGHT